MAGTRTEKGYPSLPLWVEGPKWYWQLEEYLCFELRFAFLLCSGNLGCCSAFIGRFLSDSESKKDGLSEPTCCSLELWVDPASPTALGFICLFD